MKPAATPALLSPRDAWYLERYRLGLAEGLEPRRLSTPWAQATADALLAVNGGDRDAVLKGFLGSLAPSTSAGIQEALFAVDPAAPCPTNPGRGPAPRLLSTVELLTREFLEPRAALPGFVVQGVQFLAGKPKMGKSWLALSAAIAVAGGGVFLNAVRAVAGDVLYLALEDNERRLQDRLRKLLAGQGPLPPRVTWALEWPRLNEGGFEQLEEWLQDHEAARLVIVDTLQRVRPTRKKGEDIYADDYAVGVTLKQLADRYGVAILVVHHLRKFDNGDPIDAISGTLGLAGSVDGALVLKRERGRADATLFVTGRDVEEQEVALKWDHEFCRWAMLGDAEEYRLSQGRAAVIELLRQAGRPMTPKEVSDIWEHPYSATKKLMWQMAQDGHLANTGGGRYEVNRYKYSNYSNYGNRGNCSNPGNPGNREASEVTGLPRPTPIGNPPPEAGTGTDIGLPGLGYSGYQGYHDTPGNESPAGASR